MIYGVSIGIIILAIFSCYIFLKTPIKYYLKFIIVPVIIGLSLLSAYTYDSFLGTANYSYPVGEFDVIYYDVYKKNNAMVVDLLIKQKGLKRLYTIPYSKKLVNQLNQVSVQAKKGMKVTGKFNKQHGGDGSQVNDENPLSLKISVPVVQPKEE